MPSDDAALVLDVSTSLAGAYAARLLASGAVGVIRAEPPGGHELRHWRASGMTPTSSSADSSTVTTGALFGWLAGGHRSVTVDPTSPADVDALLQLAAGVDAIVWSPGAPVDVPALQRSTSAPIVAITPFGLDGPWAARAATELTLQGLSGAPALRGSRAWPPVCAGGRHGEYMAGVIGAVATFVALRRRALTGEGGVFDISALESLIMTQLFNPITQETAPGGIRPKRYKATVADVVASKDGYVGFAVVNRVQHWIDFCLMIGRTDWADDVSLHPVVARTERSDDLNPIIRTWTSERTTADIVELAALMRIPAIEVGNGATIPKMAHFAEYGFYAENPDGGYLQPTAPFRAHPPVPGAAEVHAAPPLGPSIRDAELPARPAPRPTQPTGTLPFAGLRVADFTSFWAGPFFAHTLAMFGADVIHVESTARPDGARLMNHHPVTEDQWWELSSYFQATNTNKRGLTLDLSTDEGRDLARRLVAECDIVVENYSPRVMDGWGLSWTDVQALRPDALMVRMPAFGLGGPWRDRTGFAMTMEQVSGMAWITGFPEHAPGALFGPCDPSAGLHALIGLFAALEHRRRTGEGRLIEVPMVANALNVTAEQVIEHSAYGVLLQRDGNHGPAAAPQNCYACADDDPDLGQHRWVAVAVETDAQWQAMRTALGDPGWAAMPELDTAAGRHARQDLLDERLGAWCAARSASEVVDVLWDAGVPVAPVVHPSAQLGFEQLHHRRFFEEVVHPVAGTSTHVTFPFRLPGDVASAHRRPAPLLGEHNTEVLHDILGVDLETIEQLRASGVIGCAVAS